MNTIIRAASPKIAQLTWQALLNVLTFPGNISSVRRRA